MQGRLLIILCLLTLAQFRAYKCHAQRSSWSTKAHAAFVFQISNREAQKLLTHHRSNSVFNRLLHTQVDTFRVEKEWTRRPEKGHFIVARVIENELHCEYLGVLPYQVFLLREYNSLTLQVIDRDGNVRSDAKVRLRFMRIPFDKATSTYRLSDAYFQGNHRYVSVELDGFRSFFEVVKRERPYWAPSYYHDEGPRFYSYLITDKNRYRPGDKVRFKSYALSKSRMPLQKPLQVWLTGPRLPIHVGTVSPHRPGSYADAFTLHDSLKLQLDMNYGLELRDARSRIVARTSFTFEDYELNGDKLEVRLADAQHFYPNVNKLIMRAMDVNGLPLSDASARVVVRPVSVSGIYQPVLYLPDTLMYVERDLAAGSDTELPIPSSIFEKANITYAVDVTLVNSTNKQVNKSLTGFFQYRSNVVDAQLKGDSVIYTALNNGVATRGEDAVIRHDGEQPGTHVTLPYAEKINPTVSNVSISTSSVTEVVAMERLLPRIEILGGIERDTFKVSILNPHRIPVSWFIYRGSELLDKGFGTALDHRSAIADRSLSYYVELVYTFANRERIREREYRFNDKALDVNLQLAERVYPGQTVDATITVADQQGNPVSGVDLTAMAVNNKLGYQLPSLSDYGTLSSQREAPTKFDKHNLNSSRAVLDLDFNRWSKAAGLDTMKYYQLLYPGAKLYSHEVAIDDSTQFSIYVMQDGRSLQPYVIEVDRTPVYFSWVSAPHRYAHYVVPDQLTQVTVRLWDRVLIFDSLCFTPGNKTVLSIDLDQKPRNVKEIMMYPDMQKRRRQRPLYPHFTDIERTRYARYLAGFNAVEPNAYLMAGKQFVPIGSGLGTNQVVAGPLFPGKQTFVNNSLSFDYRFRGGSIYSFEEGVVYREPGVRLMPDRLNLQWQKPSATIDDIVLKRDVFLQTRSRELASPWITRSIEVSDHLRRLSIYLPEDENKSGVYSVLFQHPATGKATAACPLWNQHAELYHLPEGRYHLIVLYNDGSYLREENVVFNRGVHVYVDFKTRNREVANETSAGWRQEALGNCFESMPARVSVFQETRRYGVAGNVRGTVYDETGAALPGANIVIKGTAIGTVTDVDGNFSLDVPNGYSELVVTFIGYTTTEIEVRPGANVSVDMAADVTALSEVVVVGYGLDRRASALSYSVSTVLQGRVAGISAGNADEADLSETERPVDDDGDELYQALMTISAIRSNFTDVAIWEPRLYTNKKGEATFQVTFPDDITQWDATVLAMNRRLQTGSTRLAVRSFKPIMAQLDVPRFMVQGDSANAIGTVSNFSADKVIKGSYRWEGPAVSFDSLITIGTTGRYRMPLFASGRDSVGTTFVFRRDDGYQDGESRSVPLIPQGTMRANGSLSVFSPGERKVIRTRQAEHTTVEVLGGAIDVWAGEAQYLIDYRYACNEQLASKLLGLLAHKNVMRFEEKKFVYDYYVKDIIRRLLKNQNEEFLWSWWNVSSGTSYWVSAHILRALRAAQEAGYRVDLDIVNVARKASYKFDMLNSYNYHDVDLLQALAAWNAKVDYARYVARIDTLLTKEERLRSRAVYRPCSTLRERLLLMEVRQLAGLHYDRSAFTKFRKTGIRGEIYLADGRECNSWYGDELSVNVVAYRIVRRDSTLRDLILPLQLYFLSRRAASEWNTYQSANVLVSVLPDLLSMGARKLSPIGIVATLRNADADGPTGAARSTETRTYSQLPLTINLEPDSELELNMESGLPAYVMEYKTEIVTQATASTRALKISTRLGDGSGVLIAGRPAKMFVDVTVTKDAQAEYVMIEIPIPAACSYTDNKARSWNETHREYYKDRVNIYYENLTEGTHHFEVELLPRFSGVFHVNPAQVSLMYVPVINANNDMARVRVTNQ